MLENMEGTAGFDEAVLDSAWADEGDGWGPADGAEASLGHQQEGQKTPENPPAATDTREDPKGQERGQNQPEGQQRENQPELFTIQYNGKTEQMTREELIQLAQKGRDYDHTRQERDQLRQYREQNGKAIEYLEKVARKNGMDIQGFLNEMQRRELTDGGMSEQEAARELDMRRREEEVQRGREELEAQRRQEADSRRQAQEKTERMRTDIAGFLKAYPQVKPDDIPKEVWDRVNQGESLAAAYAQHEVAQLKAQAQQLQTEIEALRQNQNNAQRTPGSLGGSSGAELDEIDRLWADDD